MTSNWIRYIEEGETMTIRIILAVAVLFSFFTACPVKADSDGCIKGDCYMGRGIYQFTDGTIYKGQFSDGIIEG